MRTRRAVLKTCFFALAMAPCANEGPSLWIGQAEELQRLGRETLPVREIVERSLRFDCLLPCIEGPDSHSGLARKRFTIQSGLNSYQTCVSTIETDALLRKEFEGALRIVV